MTAPGGKIVLDGTKERQGDFVFTAQSIGEYTFCFNNEMSTFAEKMVDFEIAVCHPSRIEFGIPVTDFTQVENEQRAQLPSRQGTSAELTSSVEESIYKLSAQISTVSRNQKYFRTRENRNFSTVRSTERRIFNFSVIESLMMVSMAALQVFVVRFFFQGARKGTSNWPTSLEPVYRSEDMHSMLGGPKYDSRCLGIRLTLKQVMCDVNMSMSMRNNMMHFCYLLCLVCWPRLLDSLPNKSIGSSLVQKTGNILDMTSTLTFARLSVSWLFLRYWQEAVTARNI